MSKLLTPKRAALLAVPVVLVAVGIDGKSYSEVARMLDISAGAVRCHLARARKRLRATVEGGPNPLPFAARPARAAWPGMPASSGVTISAPALVGAD